MRLWFFLDDERYPIYKEDCDDQIVIVRSYQTMIEWINFCAKKGRPFYIDFDHDLGQSKTGYDVAKYILEHHFPLYGFKIHSMNPVGAQNIRQLLSHYGYKEIV